MPSNGYSGLLESLEENFGWRMKRSSESNSFLASSPRTFVSGAGNGSVLAEVSPVEASEVEFVARLCARHSVPLVPEGARAVSTEIPSEAFVGVRFNLMRRFRPPERLDHRSTVDPGLPWLELEQDLCEYGRSLTVYPTSAPKTTVGGWLSSDGIGIGSYEFGWLSENMLVASIVAQDGGRHEIAGSHLGHVLRSGWKAGVFVSATLGTREAGIDTPFAVNFDSSESLARALANICSQHLPVWHLGFQTGATAWGGVARTSSLLFGAYPAKRSAMVEEDLGKIVSEAGGEAAGAARAYRVWGSRFFPASPAHDAPIPGKILLPVESLDVALSTIQARLGEVAILGTVARGEEVLLLVFDFDGRRPLSLASSKYDELADEIGEYDGLHYRVTTSSEPMKSGIT